jgi:hypothetical protein
LLPAAGELVGWPDEIAHIVVAANDGTILLGDQRGRIMGWLQGAGDRAVIYATWGRLVSVTRYGGFYALSAGVIGRTDTLTGQPGWVRGGVVPTNDAAAAWGDDAGRYVGVLRKSKSASTSGHIMILDDCVVAGLRSETPSAKVASSCASGALVGGWKDSLPGGRNFPVPAKTSVTDGWIGGDALVTVEETTPTAPRMLVVRELSTFETRSQTPLGDEDEVRVAGDTLVRWNPKARTLTAGSLSRPGGTARRFAEPWAKEPCWALVGAAKQAATLRCGRSIGDASWRVVDLRTGKVAWSADAGVGGVLPDDRGAVWVAGEGGVCKVSGPSR